MKTPTGYFNVDVHSVLPNARTDHIIELFEKHLRHCSIFESRSVFNAIALKCLLLFQRNFRLVAGVAAFLARPPPNLIP